MQLQALLLAGIVLATGAKADRVMTTRSCNWLRSCSVVGEWQTEAGNKYWINAAEGCRDPDVPYIYKVCMDWRNGRAHFNADGQNKRCLQKQGPDFDVGPCADSSLKCSRQWWNEVTCTW